MHKLSTCTDTRQSVANVGRSPSGAGENGVARRGQSQTADRWPRPVTRGHLLQEPVDSDVSTSSALATTGVVDWYAFTIPCEVAHIKPSELASDIAGWLPPPTGMLERGMMGYTHGVMLPGEGRILWNDDRRDMGVHVELPSKALRLVEVDAVQLCGWVHQRSGVATRIDIALDTDAVSMDEIVNCQESGDLVSRAQDRRLIFNYRDGSQTLYVGSPKSRRLVRFYDKAKEQTSRTGEVYSGVWTRCEVQFRREQANLVSELVGLGAGLTDIIASSVDFRDSSQDTNINRCDRLSWWQAWIGKAERISFAMGSVVADVIGQAYTWVQKQVAPTLAFLKRALGEDALDALVDAAKGRIPEYRLRVLAVMSQGVA